MLTENEMLEGLAALGLTAEDLQNRKRIEPLALLMAQQVRGRMPDSLSVEAHFSASTGRKGVQNAATDYLLGLGWNHAVADTASRAAFQNGVDLWQTRPELWQWFQLTIGQNPVLPNLPFILKNYMAEAVPMPEIEPQLEGGE